MNEYIKNIINELFNILKTWTPIIISIFALWYSMSLNKKFVEPEIITTMKWIYKDINGKYGPDLYNPMLKIFNNGPLKVVSLDVIYYTYSVDFDNNALVMLSSSMGFNKGNLKFIYKKELNVFDYEEQGAWNMSADFPQHHIVSVNVFDIKYYRESDLKEYKRKDIYFIDNSVIYTQKEYMNKDTYDKAISNLERASLENKEFLEKAITHIPNI